MKNLEGYRREVGEEVKRIFVDSLKGAIEELDLEHIGFIGIIGSFKEEYSHDIDILVFPGPDSKIGETLIEVADLYQKVEKHLKEKHERLYLSIAPKHDKQEMIYYLSSLQEGDSGMIPVHSLFFPDFKSFEKFNPEGFKESIKESLTTLWGDFDVIHDSRSESIPFKKEEPYFVIRNFEINAKAKKHSHGI